MQQTEPPNLSDSVGTASQMAVEKKKKKDNNDDTNLRKGTDKSRARKYEQKTKMKLAKVAGTLGKVVLTLSKNLGSNNLGSSSES